MTDPLTASVMVILGKYAIDQGAALAKEVGPAAAEKARALAGKALAALRRQPRGEMVAEEYLEDPESTATLAEKKLAAALAENEALRAELKTLLADYEAAAGGSGPSYEAQVEGGGAIAQGEGAAAVGERGVNVQDSTTGGPIITGSGNTVNYGGGSAQVAKNLPGDLAAIRDNLIEYFNKAELRGLAFELGIRHEELPGETLSELAQSLVIYCRQRGRLGELVDLGRRERPHVSW
jgi:hypothetical protein